MPRPREFDEEEVVASAMAVFWCEGFDGSSFDALEEATGLNRSSLYNAFGGKSELFAAALEAYSDGPCAALHRPLSDRSGSAALRGYLDGLISFLRSPSGGLGCLMVNTSLKAPTSPQAQAKVESHFGSLRKALVSAFRETKARGVLRKDSPQAAADWLLAVVRGVLCGAVAGESRASLARVLTITKTIIGV